MSKDSSKKPEQQTESQEITGTLTDLGFEESSSNTEAALKRLLGSAPLRLAASDSVLLLPTEAFRRPDLLKAEQIEEAKDFGNRIVVLGPYTLQELKAKATGGILEKADRIQFAGSRWKPVLEEFPEWASDIVGADEISRTTELPALDQLMTQSTEGVLEGSLELEEVREEERVRVSAGQKPLSKTAPDLEQPRDLESERVAVATEPSLISKTSRGLGPVQLTLALTGALALGFWMLKIYRGPSLSEPAPIISTKVLDTKVKSNLDWPENLRPRLASSIYSDENAMLARIRPVLQAYEAGVTVLNQADEMLLKRYADPASANWDARKLAANQLAVYMMVRSDLERARQFLMPIVQADPGDFTTLVNVSLLDIWEGRLATAREALRVASRINGDMRWLTLSLLGVVEGHADRWPAATASFEDALKAQPNNPYIQGLWMQALIKSNRQTRSQIQKLVSDALWSDPDALLDSPLPAPIASHLIHLEALDGLQRGAESMGAPALSEGQLSFVRWLKARATGFSTSTPSIAQVSKQLEVEEGLQSQVLYAFTLKEQGHFDNASQVLAKVLPLIENRKLTGSSWPWTLAGDVEAARAHFDQAILFYQSALNRNNLDYAAVYGLAMTLRDRGQYVEAEQKLREALSLQPSFMPARLRVSRLEWQGLTRSQ